MFVYEEDIPILQTLVTTQRPGIALLCLVYTSQLLCSNWLKSLDANEPYHFQFVLRHLFTCLHFVSQQSEVEQVTSN